MFYIANCLPKSHTYIIEVGACFLLGLIWIQLFYKTIKCLDALSTDDWCLKFPVDHDIACDHELTVKYH